MLEYDMITLDAFLVLLAAASLPATYILILSRWIEPAYRQDYPETTAQEAKPIAKRDLVPQPA
jgi:hypothetical protein